MYTPPIGYDAKVAPGRVPGTTPQRHRRGGLGTRLEREAVEASCSCMRIPPLRSAVKMESDVSPRTHAVVNTGVGTSVLASDGVQPLPPLMYISTFRLILPEAIAIGVRFSHASCTSLDS